MKYLSNYTESAQTDAFNKYGAFFAFSDKQFNKQKKEGIKYASVGAGLIAPTENVSSLMDSLLSIHASAIEQDIAENGIKAIIHRELANYECQITMDYSDCMSALDGYGISEAQIKAEWPAFWDNCVENDWF